METNRNGKIARLPRDLRDRLNQCLYQGWSAVRLVDCLNQIPMVKTILAQHFNGRPINKQNLTEWKQGGYRDWLARQHNIRKENEFASDIRELTEPADDLANSLFAMLTMDYARLMKNRDTETSEDFEKKRQALSVLAQDIVRLRRSHLGARRVEIQQEHLDRVEEKTEEQLIEKFAEWVQNPEIRKAFILAPMERMRRMRELSGLPPKPEDPFVQRETQNDPAFAPSNPGQTKIKPESGQSNQNQTKKNNSNSGSSSPPPASEGRAVSPLTAASSEPPASSPATTKDISPIGPVSPIASTDSAPLIYAGKPTSQIIAEIEEQYARKHATNLESISSTSSMPSMSSTPSNSSLVTHQPRVASSLGFYGPCPPPGDNWKVKTA